MHAPLALPPAVRTACPYCGVGCGVLARPDGQGGAITTGDPDLFLYLPFASPDFGSRSGTLLIKSPLTLNEVVRRVEAAAKDVDSTLPVQFSRTLRSNVDTMLRDRRLFAIVTPFEIVVRQTRIADQRRFTRRNHNHRTPLDRLADHKRRCGKYPTALV